MRPGPELDNEVRVGIYRFFLEQGRAPVATEIAERLSSSPFQVEEAFRRLHENHIVVLAPGTPYIWMANPFSALPTPYLVRSAEKTFWGNCIWDALGILGMIGSDGTVSARCPDCSEPLSVEVRDGELANPGGLVHYAVPAAAWWDDIGFN